MKRLNEKSLGFLYAVGAFVFWGLVPLFWILLKSIPPLQILAHRIVWSFIFFIGLFFYRGEIGVLARNLRSKKVLLSNFPNALFIGSNWGLYIYAVNSGHAVEASLGYFINPILNVVIGALAFKERISRNIWIAFAFVVFGLLIMGSGHNRFPWISVSLASTFCLYGIFKKKNHLSGLQSISVECALLLPIALFLLFSPQMGQVDILSLERGLTFSILISIGGALTAVPLIWFSEAAKRIPFSTLGFFGYLSPMLQLAIAIFIFKEDINSERILALCFVWIGLLVYVIDGIRKSSITLRKTAKS
ncbi:MAG: EamA family transporter RarD [Pseudomonadota bacterium]